MLLSIESLPKENNYEPIIHNLLALLYLSNYLHVFSNDFGGLSHVFSSDFGVFLHVFSSDFGRRCLQKYTNSQLNPKAEDGSRMADTDGIRHFILQLAAVRLDDLPRGDVFLGAGYEHTFFPSGATEWQEEPKHLRRDSFATFRRADAVADVAAAFHEFR